MDSSDVSIPDDHNSSTARTSDAPWRVLPPRDGLRSCMTSPFKSCGEDPIHGYLAQSGEYIPSLYMSLLTRK